MKQILFLLIAVCVACSDGMSQGGSKPKASDEKPPSAAQMEDFIIGPEDVLFVNVWHEPELTQKVTVRPDGKIGMPLLNDVQASGLTTRQLQQRIGEGLKAFVNDLQMSSISVIVAEIHSQVLYINGAVNRPGVYPFGGPMTVMELLIRAGGLADFAKSEEIQILRKNSTSMSRFRFNYKSFLEGKDYQQNIPLRSGDMVIVP